MVKPPRKASSLRAARAGVRGSPAHAQAEISAGSTIRAVEIETGIHAMTLREWERRFGFPAPERRPGSNRRLYSRADVARLKLVKLALGRGYRIGDVVRKSSDELAAIASSDGSLAAVGEPRPTLEIDALVRLLAEERMEDFEREVRRARSTLNARAFLLDFAHPLVVEIGKAWERAQLSVRHEHLASDCLTTVLRQMLADLQPAGTHPSVLLASLPGEVYSLPMLFVAVFLGTLGAKVRLLGRETPPGELVTAANALRVDAVGLAISERFDARDARRAVNKVRASLPAAIPLWTGGAGAVGHAGSEAPVRVLQSWKDIESEVTSLRAARFRSPSGGARRNAAAS